MNKRAAAILKRLFWLRERDLALIKPKHFVFLNGPISALSTFLIQNSLLAFSVSLSNFILIHSFIYRIFLILCQFMFVFFLLNSRKFIGKYYDIIWQEPHAQCSMWYNKWTRITPLSMRTKGGNIYVKMNFDKCTHAPIYFKSDKKEIMNCNVSQQILTK